MPKATPLSKAMLRAPVCFNADHPSPPGQSSRITPSQAVPRASVRPAGANATDQTFLRKVRRPLPPSGPLSVAVP